MHRIHNAPRIKDGPQTAGATLHWAAEYDLFSNLMGMGAKGRNSRMVIELAGIRAGESVLDVCCGTGNLTLTAKSYAGPNGKVHGIDAAPEMIEAARKNAARARLEVAFDVGLAEQLAFPDASFEVVISRLAIHHLPGDLKHKAFAEMLRVLRPGGRLLIADFTPPANPFLNHIFSAMVGSGMMQTDISKLPPMLESAGFAQVRSGPTASAFLGFVAGQKPAK